MSRHLIFKVLFQSDYTSKDALMKVYGNEDYVAHYHEIHPARPQSTRWAFAMIGRFWKGLGQRRQLRLVSCRLDSLSSHLLADIGAGSFATLAGVEGRIADQQQLITALQAEAWEAMAALARAQKFPPQAASAPNLADAAIETLVVRPRGSGPRIRNMALGGAGGTAVQSA